MIAILIQEITSDWMDVVSIYISARSALCWPVSCSSGLPVEFVSTKSTTASRNPSATGSYPLPSMSTICLCIVALVEGAALGGIG